MKKIALVLIFILLSCTQKPIQKNTVIGILPYKGISNSKVLRLEKAIHQYYGINTKILTEQDYPETAFINIKSPRYRADSIIIIQNRQIPNDVDYILGLAEKDISITKHDNDGNIKKPVWKYNDFGIMGLAYCPGKSCIVSGFRLKHANKEVHFERFKKVVIHELGHNFGLRHCTDKQCVMTDAVESIKTVDNAKPGLCSKCKKKLKIKIPS